MGNQLPTHASAGLHPFYLVNFRNHGGLVMPIIVRLTYGDGTQEIVRLPAEMWRENSVSCTKGFITEKELKQIELDPRRETADTNRDNNYFPPRLEPSRFKLFKDSKSQPGNPMRTERERQEAERKKAEEAKKAEQNKAQESKAEPKPAEQPK